MKETLMNISRRHAAFGCCLLLIVSLVYSKFLLSISMMSLVAISLFQWDFNQKMPLRWNPNLRDNLRNFSQNKSLLAVTLFFFIVLLGAFYSSDADYMLERLRIRLPFLFLPLAFAGIPAFTRREYYGLLYALVILVLVASIGVFSHYLLYYDELTSRLGMGQAIPTPMNHIRFSLVLAFALVVLMELIRKGYIARYTWEPYAQYVALAFLVLFIHILSVRSGLIAFYLCLLYITIRYIYLTRRWSVGAAALVLTIALPWLAYQHIPSFNMRINYALYDWHMNQRGVGDQYSDSDRIKSMKVGLQIGNERPLIGVGAGDLRSAVEKRYAKEYPQSHEPKMPHNQLVSVYAGSGIIGLSLFLIAFFVPLLYRRHYCNTVFACLHIIVFFSFMSESTIENAIGTAFYLFFLLLGLNYLDRKTASDDTVKA